MKIKFSKSLEKLASYEDHYLLVKNIYNTILG